MGKWTNLIVLLRQEGARRDGVGVPSGPLLIEASDALHDLEAQLAEARGAKDGAYSERNKLVAAISKMLPSWLERHPDEDKEWEDDWRWIVFIATDWTRYGHQMSWHIHDSELSQFDHLDRQEGNSWDGHTVDGKYERLASIEGFRHTPTPPAAEEEEG